MSDGPATNRLGAGKRTEGGNGSVVGESLTLGTLASPRLKRLHAVWSEHCGARRWPTRGDLKPEAIAFILGTVVLVDVLRDPLRFRFRLVGSHIEEVGRRGDQGRMLDDIEPPYYAAFVRDGYTEAVTSGACLIDRITFHPATRPTLQPLTYERLVLPLSSDGAVIDMLLVASDWPREISNDLRKFHAEG